MNGAHACDYCDQPATQRHGGPWWAPAPVPQQMLCDGCTDHAIEQQGGAA